MLNRIYIVIGLLAILALGGAFIAPRFIQWGDYRLRMEELAAGVMGTEVSIRGDIAFSLLPQPQLRFSDVVVGGADAPSLRVQTVEAEFSLTDFLRDRYSVTRLVLQQPVFDLRIDQAGTIQADLALPEAVAESTVSIVNAFIEDGQISLTDARSADSLAIGSIGGELRLGSLAGPFQFQGSGTVGDDLYAARFNSSEPDETGASRLSVFLRPETGAFSMSAEGSLVAGQQPRFEGTLVYRQAPPSGATADAARGDLILEGQVNADLQQVRLNTYTLVPDENRAGTRLTGAAAVQLGESRTFNAVISGGVLGLPPRDATQDQTGQPYELVRLLTELPEPFIVPMAGTINVDIAEVGLRPLSLRDVRLDATSDGKVWRVDHFQARLPGDTSLTMRGQLASVEGRPSFLGEADLATSRLETFAQLWRRSEDTQALLNQAAELHTTVSLDGDRLDLINLRLTLDGSAHVGSVGLTSGPERRLDLNMGFGALTPAGSAALAALFPDVANDPGFAASFPQGAFAVQVDAATVLGLQGTNLAAEGSWGAQDLRFDRLAAGDLGGVGFDLTGSMAGTLLEPRFAGSGSVRVDSASAAALDAVYEAFSTPVAWREAIGRNLPTEVRLQLTEHSPEGSQQLLVDGQAGGTEVNLDAKLSAGLAGSLTEPLSAVLDVSALDGAILSRQLGWGERSLIGEGSPVQMTAAIEGSPATSLALRLEANSETERLGFSGQATASDAGAVTLEGTVSGAVAEGTGLIGLVTGAEVVAPALEGEANLRIEGPQGFSITGFEGVLGDQQVSGEMHLDRAGGANAISGILQASSIDVSALLAALGGPAASVNLEGGLWPDGPFDLGAERRERTGALRVSTPSLTGGGRTLMTDAAFDFAWDAEGSRIRALSGNLGGGRLNADVGICCTGDLSDKQVTARLGLENVALDSILPPVPAGGLDGILDLGVQVQGTGSSLAAAIADLSGEGSFTLTGLAISQLSPGVFSTVAGVPNILELEPDALTGIASMALEANPFAASEASGAFTVAAGTVRIANLGAEGQGGRLFGDAALHLADLALSGAFSLTPQGLTDPNGLVSDAASEITAALSGTLLAPMRAIDLQAMIDAVQLRANELELDRLEARRLEDDARSRAAAEERNRLIAEQQRQRQAQEAEELEATRQREAEAEAERLAQERRAAEERARNNTPAPEQTPIPQPLPQLQPFDLGLPPANQVF